jgi:hypothetical protein
MAGATRPVDRLRNLLPTVVDAGISVVLITLEAAELTPADGPTMLMAAGALILVLAACLIVRQRGPDRLADRQEQRALANIGEPTEAPLADLSVRRAALTIDAAIHPHHGPAF